MNKKLLVFLFFSFSFLGFSQEKVIQGKIIINASSRNIRVENINRELSVLTDENGIFKIIANPGEVLVFSGVNVVRKIFLLSEEHFTSSIEIKLKTSAIEIEEVEIGNQIDLGFGGKKYTQAERNYKTSGQILKLNQGFEFNLEAIGNLFNGKRKELKKALKIEETNKLLYKLDAYFDEDFYLNLLGLDPAYIKDFKYFLIDDHRFKTVLNYGNESDIIIESIKTYEVYKKIKTGEN